MTYTAVVERRGDVLVVVEADPVVHVTPELWEQISPDLADGVWTFGTPNEGLGVVSYRDTGRLTDTGCVIMERVMG